MPRPPEFSEMLTERRRELGYSVGQAAQALRLKEQVLQAFEDGDFASMPKSGYAQGMLASYARFLGLDAQEVTDLFSRALDEYRAGLGYGGSRGRTRASRGREQGRPARPASNQPQVPRRGLLPTSGGIAGDLGDYATTSPARPHGGRRASYTSQDDSYRQRGQRNPTPYSRYEGRAGSGRPYSVQRSDASYDDAARYDGGAHEMVRRARTDYGGRDISTRSVRSGEYVDDLRYDDDVRTYTPASTRGGRPTDRTIPPAGRPNVQRRPSDTQRRQMRSRGRRPQERGIAAEFRAQPARFIALVVVLVAVIITLILILAVTSCSSFSTRGDGNRSVPVSQATTQGSNQTSSASNNANDKSAEDAAAKAQIAAQSGRQNAGDDPQQETDVTVAVADGAVTWLEVDCDGESKVAETVTGPWTQTYVVTQSITVQAGDTTAVTVSKNGSQVQFDSRASGIGTVTIQGTKVDANSGTATTGTSSKVSDGNASANANAGSSTSASEQAGGSSSGSTSESGPSTSTSGSASLGSADIAADDE